MNRRDLNNIVQVLKKERASKKEKVSASFRRWGITIEAVICEAKTDNHLSRNFLR